MQTKKIIYFWASDVSKNSGEGILANSFLKNFSKDNKNIRFVNLNLNDKFQKNDLFFKNIKNFETFYHKYFYSFKGILKLWTNFFSGKKVCYLNYLPLWNFLIFLLLPPKTLIGPITGTAYRKRYSLLINIFEIISLTIINFRFKKIYFSHNFYLSKYSLNKKKFKGNYILKDFCYKKKKKSKKKFDFVLYYRKQSKLKKNYLINLIKLLNSCNNNFAILGDKININKEKNKNFGFVTRKKASTIISKSKYAISNPENLYSYFTQDCLSHDLLVFYNKIYFQHNIFKHQMKPISYTFYKKDYSIIKNYIKK